MLRTTLLLGALTGLLMAFGQALGGSQGVTIALIFAVIMNFGAYWFSDKIVLKMYSAREVTEGLMRMMDEREVTGVLAHELGHVQNRDILISTIAATIGGAIVHIATMA